MIPFALKFVREDKIAEHLKLGWMGARPNAAHHHLEYGIEMKWICRCPVPGGFKFALRKSYSHRVPETQTIESAKHERAAGT